MWRILNNLVKFLTKQPQNDKQNPKFQNFSSAIPEKHLMPQIPSKIKSIIVT